MCYETACFDQKTTSAAQKLWTVGVQHKADLRADPVVGNALVKTTLADACALDEPSKQKIPMAKTPLAALRDKLDLQTQPGFTFWTGIRFAIAFLCRISEWAFDDLYTVKWKHVLFWTSELHQSTLQMDGGASG